MKEVPPTAGLPLVWRDFVGGAGGFETELAAWLQTPQVRVECSGTAVLWLTLLALKEGSRRRSVIIPAYTCPLVAIAVAKSGLKPVPCDVKPGHFELCPEALQAVCGDDTLAIVPTHLGGRVADLAPVLDIAGRSGARVIEDAAQALGAKWQGKSVGLSGDAGFFSLAVGKGLTLFEGGVLVAREANLRRKLFARIRETVSARLFWEIRRLVELAGYAALYRPACLPYVYGNPLRRALERGDPVAAVGDDFDFEIPLHRVGGLRQRVGANALARLPAFLRETARLAMERLPRLPFPVLADAPGGEGVWPFFMLLLPSEKARDAALNRLWRTGLGVSRLFVHALPDYAYLRPLLAEAAAPNARDLAARMLTVSNSPWLDDEGFAQVCDVLGSV